MAKRTGIQLKPIEPHRSETRRQRYDKKSLTAKTLPISICTVNFGLDENLAMMIRSACCYGAESVMIIGNRPPDSYLRPRSGTTINYIDIIQFATPHDFLEHCRKNNYQIVSAELCDAAMNLNQFEFDFSRHTVIVTGNEWTGVPEEIIHHSQPIYLPMIGRGHCLNTVITGSVMLNEFQRQFSLANEA